MPNDKTKNYMEKSKRIARDADRSLQYRYSSARAETDKLGSESRRASLKAGQRPSRAMAHQPVSMTTWRRRLL